MTEAQIQAQLIKWWLLAHKGIGVPDPRLLIMIPNGAYFGAGVKQLRNGKTVSLAAIRFAHLKRQGFVQGAPDLFLAVCRSRYAGLWLEMKRPKSGKVSDEQRALHAVLRAQGYAVVVAFGFERAVDCLTNYLAGQPITDA
jgi:hypothetical protein